MSSALELKALREERKKQNICVACGKWPPKKDAIWCAKCGKHAYQLNLKIRKRRAAKHLCIRCCKPIVKAKHCADCWDKKLDNANKYYMRQKETKHCVKCGKKHSTKHVRCERCLSNRRQKEYQVPKYLRRAFGISSEVRVPKKTIIQFNADFRQHFLPKLNLKPKHKRVINYLLDEHSKREIANKLSMSYRYVFQIEDVICKELLRIAQ